MMSAMSVVALLWVGLFSGLIPGHRALTVRDALTAEPADPAPSGVEQILDRLITMEHKMDSRLNTMEHKMDSRNQIVQFSWPVVGGGSSLDPTVVTNKLLALEAKQDVMKTKLEATEAELGAMKTKLEATETKLEATETALQATRAQRKGASTFVRWGRKTCSNSSQLVYSGVAGGSFYDHPGAAANLLCVTLSPQTDSTTSSAYSYLYGAEYEHIPNHQDQDVPCCVCRAPQTTTITIPGTHDCPAGWTPQYTGHLAAGRPRHNAASQYVCLDGHLENASNGHRDEDGYVLYYTTAQCGSLPCPPYTRGKVVLCVVCSK